MSSSPAPPRSARKASIGTDVPSSNGSWKQGSPHSRGLSAPVDELQYGSRSSGLRFSASPVEVGGSMVRDVQLGTPTSAPAHPNCMGEAAAVAGLSRQNSFERQGAVSIPMPPPPKRVHSVATFKALHNMVEIEPMAKPGGPADFHGGSLDSAAESQRVQNAWWRTWSLHNRQKSALKDVTFAHSESPGDTLRISSDALSVEGMDKSHRPKIWEEFYNIFLERLASNDGASFLAHLAENKSSVGRTSSLDSSLGGSRSEVASTVGELGGSQQGGEGPGLMMDESVHGANLFAAMFRSDPNASMTTPTTSSEDFSNFTLPWDPHPHASGRAGAAVSPPLSPPAVGMDPAAPQLDRSSKSRPMQIPKPASASRTAHDEEAEHQRAGTATSGKPPRVPPALEHHATSSGSAVETILKKAFTAVHNSHKFGHDSASPYLGDDLSVHQNSIFAGQSFAGPLSTSQGLRMRHSPSSSVVGLGALCPSRSRSDLLKLGGGGAYDPEGSVPRTPGTRSPVLQRICSCAQWKRTEQHWLLPAVIAMCSEEVVSPPSSHQGPGGNLLSHALSGYGDLEAEEPVDLMLPLDPEEEVVPLPPLAFDPFQTYVLGEVLMCSPSLLGHGDFRHLPTKWEARLLVVKQNYLFEYLPGEPKRPIGFLHLQGSTASARLDHKHVLHLVTLAEMGSPSSSASASSISPPTSSGGLMPTPHQTTLLQARSPAQAHRWAAFLEKAAAVSTEDLFEYVPIKSGAEASGVTGGAALKAAELGRGRFAVVRKARRRRYSERAKREASKDNLGGGGDETVCALKVVNKHQFWARVADGKERHDTLVREILGQGILTAQGGAGAMGADCPIVRLYSVFETAESVVLELELMSRNDLFDELSTAGVLKEHKTAAIVYQVVLAVNFCREYNIAHRDVKLSNIIFPLDAHENPAHALKVKLADFGMAGFFGKDGTLRGRCGTPGYVAPEILCAGVNEGYGNNVDIFSVGVVAYTLLCGYEPFYGVTDKQLIAANKLAEYEFHDPEWTRISHEAKDLVSKMLLRDPERRITPSQALEHPWLSRFHGPEAATPWAAQAKRYEQQAAEAGLPPGLAGSSPQDRALDKAARLSSSLRSQYASPPCCVM